MQTFLEYVGGRKIDKKKIDRIGDYTIYTVNASAIRDSSQANDQFNHLATHMEFPKLVPNNEIWISQDISQHERQFLIHNGLNQYKAKKLGKRNWYAYALKKEKREREVVDHIKFKSDPAQKPPEKIYYKYYCGIPNENDDIEVWLVNGEIVRDLFKSDFIEGGNAEIYGKWLPKGEIWIERNLSQSEINITILHEYVERTLMKYKKLPYDKAHTIASKVEWHHRKKKWNIDDVKLLNAEEALEMAKKYL